MDTVQPRDQGGSGKRRVCKGRAEPRQQAKLKDRAAVLFTEGAELPQPKGQTRDKLELVC